MLSASKFATRAAIHRSLLSGLQKGPAERGHVKKRQNSSKSVKKFFDTFRQFSRRAKNVKNRQKVSKRFSTLFDNFRAGHLFSGPFCNPLISGLPKRLFLRLFLGGGGGISGLHRPETPVNGRSGRNFQFQPWDASASAIRALTRMLSKLLGCTPRGSCNNTLLRRVLRRFSSSKCFLEGFLEGACKGFQ